VGIRIYLLLPAVTGDIKETINELKNKIMEFHDNYPQYELMAHHSEEAGVKTRKQLWRVFWIMLLITLVELGIGFSVTEFPKPFWYIVLFLAFTILKAYFIVYSFMHLGHEMKGLKWAIIAPFSLFIIYFTWIVANEGTYNSAHGRKLGMDPNVIEQINAQRSGHGHGQQNGDNTEDPKHGQEGHDVH
jgi:caa(3)-type oxidase subunit IV